MEMKADGRKKKGGGTTQYVKIILSCFDKLKANYAGLVCL